MRKWFGGLLLGAVLLLSTSSFSEFDKAPLAPEMVPGEILVKAEFTPNEIGVMSLNQIFGTVGAKLLKTYTLVPGLYHLQVAPGTEAKAIKRLQMQNGIAYAEPNYIYRVSLFKRGYVETSSEDPEQLIPNDEHFGKLWGLHNTGQDIQGQQGEVDADIDAPEAWAAGHTGSHDILVAVIDTGVDYTHADLVDNAWSNPGATGTYVDPETGETMDRATDKVDNDDNGFIDDVHGWDFANDDNDPMDDHGHGTHCSGTIGGAGNNEIGVAGVNHRVKIMGVKFLTAGGSGTLADAVSAVEYATLMGAHVQSNSWGGGGFSQSLADAIEAANEAGSLFVAAAGNSGTNTDNYPHYPSSYEMDNVLAVSATDNKDRLASWSNFGRTSVDVGAPGVNIYSTIPGGYTFMSGTSMATPHVAGLAALILSAEPTLAIAALKERIMKTSEEIRGLLRKVQSGSRINADYALRSFYPPRSGSFTPEHPWVVEEFSAESPHNYTNDYNNTWTIEKEGAVGIRIHFEDIRTEAGYDFVTVRDGDGNEVDLFDGAVGEIWSFEVEGSKATITFKSDGSVTDWGFKVDSFAYRME